MNRIGLEKQNWKQQYKSTIAWKKYEKINNEKEQNRKKMRNNFMKWSAVLKQVYDTYNVIDECESKWCGMCFTFFSVFSSCCCYRLFFLFISLSSRSFTFDLTHFKCYEPINVYSIGILVWFVWLIKFDMMILIGVHVKNNANIMCIKLEL